MSANRTIPGMMWLNGWLLCLRGKVMRHRWTATATGVFAKTKYAPDEQDVTSLAENMALIEATGLHALNRRLTQANRKVFDTIAELNVAAMLIRHLGGSGIEYEPPDYGARPVDFRIRHREVAVHLQMKRFGDLERDNRRDAVLEQIKQRAARIDVRKFFGVALKEEFSENHVQALLDFLAATAPAAPDGHAYEFKVNGTVFGAVEFWAPKSVALPHLTLGVASNADVVNITGLATDQLKASMRKAAAAFTAPVDGKNINLVAAESDKHHDIDICNACFGTEEDLFGANGRHAWHRLGDGLFTEPASTERLAGVVVLRRPDRSRPVSAYEAFLFINEPHLKWADEIRSTIPIAKIVRYNMRP